MAAFERIKSGFPGIDEILDNIRLGDNVVWRVSNLDEFRMFAQPFVEQAIKDGRSVTYFRFAGHEPLLKDTTGVDVVKFDPDVGFESFTVAIHEEITRKGYNAFYVFDCLSELQSVWYTDLMMGNFFRVTCPYLFQLDTVAYFPLMRGRHSLDAVNRIRETTQLFLDIYSGKDRIYLQPIKVWNRNTDSMFLPSEYKLNSDNAKMKTIRDGISTSRFYQVCNRQNVLEVNHDTDSYDRFFEMARQANEKGEFTSKMEDMIIDSTMTKDPHLKKLVKQYFSSDDYFMLRDRMIGSGAIGGKACGMLLARKICENRITDYLDYEEPHDSFYVGSDVFYTYIVYNDDWGLRIEQRSGEGYFSKSEDLKNRLLSGQFPSSIREQFRKVIDYFGQAPYIVRSSSFLEDGFGNAFAGKYQSVFCVNHGDPEKRLDEFEQAVRIVYASTMDYSALEYRRLRGLDKKDEQMAILVQRVSGSYWGKYFMPGAAGVGYSHSDYKWLPEMDPDAGMLRIVMGLGTKAVDRTEVDYPRLSNLDAPTKTIYSTVKEKHQYSQRFVDVLDTSKNELVSMPMERLLSDIPYWYKRIVLEHDWEAEQNLRNAGNNRDVWFVSCEKLLSNNNFTSLMQKILHTLETVYGNSVDIEYAINMNEENDFVVNLLQCRPLYRDESGEMIDFDDISFQKVYFEIKNSSMGTSVKRPIDVVINVDPVLYYNFPYARKSEVASVIGKINHYYQGKGKNILFMTPGRIGTSSPELGVPVSFGDISNFSVICEISETRAGYRPELSYGSHIFQDLVEAKIVYGAIFGNEKTIEYNPNLLNKCDDKFLEICPGLNDLEGMITVYEVKDLWYCLDAKNNWAACGIRKN